MKAKLNMAVLKSVVLKRAELTTAELNGNLVFDAGIEFAQGSSVLPAVT